MHKRPEFITTVLVLIVIIALGIVYIAYCMEKSESSLNQNTMKIQSSAFQHEELIPELYTCDGKNINPPLAISDVPQEAQSLAMIVDDPDAPRTTFVHWVVWNIDPSTTMINEQSVPSGAKQGKTDFDGVLGFGGPCPHTGEHRYFFTLYALDTVLDLQEGASKQDLEQAMKGHILEQTELMGRYQRE